MLVAKKGRAVAKKKRAGGHSSIHEGIVVPVGRQLCQLRLKDSDSSEKRCSGNLEPRRKWGLSSWSKATALKVFRGDLKSKLEKKRDSNNGRRT